MDSVLKQIREIAAGLRYPENWVSSVGAIALATILFLVASAVTPLLPVEFLNAIRVPQPWVWLVRPIVAIVLPALGLLGWVVAREIYWRSGSGVRIGVSFEGYKVPPDDWVQVRREIRHLLENAHLSRRVKIRVFPGSMSATQPRWERTKRKYGLSSFFRCLRAPPLKAGDINISYNFSSEIGDCVDPQFMQVVDVHTRTILNHQRPLRDLRDLNQFQADTLFDVLLFHLGAAAFVASQMQEAGAYYGKLVERLEARRSVPPGTLVNIKWLHALSFVYDSAFPGDSPPAAEALISATERCEAAAKTYGSLFPTLHNKLARDLFYMRELERAVAHTELALNAGVAEVELANTLLNRAVLFLLLDRYDESERCFADFLSSGFVASFDWNDLIRFADHAYQYGHRQALFIRALYRKLNEITLDRALAKSIHDWFAVDPRRNSLQALYLGELPILPKQSRAAAQALTTVAKNKKRDKHQRGAKRKKRRH
jgi:hypothetical protein